VSRHFDGTGDHLDYAGALVVGQPVTFSCWIKRDSVASDRLMTIGVSGTDQNYNGLWISSAGAALAVSATSTATSSASTTVLASTDLDWAHVAAVCAASNDRRSYLRGAGKGTSSNTRSPAGQNAFRVGESLGGGGGFTGYISHMAVWSAALDDSEIAALAAGAIPTAIRPGSLVDYWELPSGGSLTGVNGTVLTATNTTASAESPTILSSSAPAIQAATFRAPVVGGKRRTGGVSQTDTTAPSPAPILATPTGITQTTFDLSWSASFDAQSGLRRYNIERSSTSATDGFAPVTSVSLTFLAYKDTALVANTRYWHRVIAEDFAGNLSTSNVVTATTLQANTGPPGPSQTKIWSRTASHPSSGQQNYENSNVIAALAKRKINSLTAFPGWEKNAARTAAGKTPGIIQAIKAASTINTEVVAYLIYQSIQTVHDTPGNSNYEAYQKLKTAKWFGYGNGITETPIINDRVSGFVKTNYADTCKVVSGKIWRDWFLEWTIAFLRDGATVSNGLTSYTQAVNPY